MSDVFAFLSERWLRFAEKINGAIFSFVFFWGTIAFLYHFEKKIFDYLVRMEQASGNHGYFALQIVLVVVSVMFDFMWFIMPFYVAGAIYYWDKMDK